MRQWLLTIPSRFCQLVFVARSFGPRIATTCKQQTIGVCRGMHIYMVARFSSDSSVYSQLPVGLHLLHFICFLQSSFEHHGSCSSQRRLSYLQVGVPRTPWDLNCSQRWKCHHCSSRCPSFQGTGGNTSLSDELIFCFLPTFQWFVEVLENGNVAIQHPANRWPSRSLSYKKPELGERIILGPVSDFPTREWRLEFAKNLPFPIPILSVWTLKSRFPSISLPPFTWQHTCPWKGTHRRPFTPLHWTPAGIFLPLSSDGVRCWSSWSSNLGLLKMPGWRTHGCLNVYLMNKNFKVLFLLASRNCVSEYMNGEWIQTYVLQRNNNHPSHGMGKLTGLAEWVSIKWPSLQRRPLQSSAWKGTGALGMDHWPVLMSGRFFEQRYM